MQKEISIRTDLALESYDSNDNKLPQGVFVDEQKSGGVLKTTVKIDTEEAAERLARPIGKYITLEGDFSLFSDQLCDMLETELKALLPIGSVLVIGLGNRDITPDIIGPMAASKIMATRHLFSEQLERLGLENLRSVCSISPGVMGQTGLEVLDIVKPLLREQKFSAVIAIDALAAKSAGRLGSTIQLCTCGISPGSGVLNRRAELSQQTLGLPVFAIGIPTVVDASTLIADLCPQCEDFSATQTMMVTPRDIDNICAIGSKIISRAINYALQPSLSHDEIDALTS